MNSVQPLDVIELEVPVAGSSLPSWSDQYTRSSRCVSVRMPEQRKR